MLKKVKIRNFKSVLDESISLEYREKKAPNGYENMENIVFLENKKEERFVPLLMLFGANASGKSNVIEAMRVFGDVFRKGIKNKYFPNKLNRKFCSSKFNISFENENTDYDYAIEYDGDKILEETLMVNGQILFSIDAKEELKMDFQKLYKKDYGKSELMQVLDTECCDINRNQINSFLFRLSQKYPGLNNFLSKSCQWLLSNSFASMTNDYNPLIIKRIFFDKGLPDQILTVTEIIKKLDIDISQFHFTNELDSSIITYHKDTDNKEVAFDFLKEESLGTRRLFGLIAIILNALDNGLALFIDEMDASLHPFIMTYLIGMFKNKKTNPKGAQLILTSHNPYIMEDEAIRICEIAIVEKTLEHGTQIKYLYQFKGIRNVTDFAKNYLDSRFGGVPLTY